MRSSFSSSAFLCLFLLSSFLSSSTAISATPPESPLAARPEVWKIKKVRGKKFRFVKYLDPITGNVESAVYKLNGRRIDPDRQFPKKSVPKISSKLSLAMKQSEADSEFEIIVSIKTPTLKVRNEQSAHTEATIVDGAAIVKINGRHESHSGQVAFSESRSRESVVPRVDRYNKKVTKRWRKIQKKNSWITGGQIEMAISSGSPSIVTSATKRQIERLVRRNRSLISEIDLYEVPVKQMAEAMVDTGVDPIAFDLGVTGAGVGVYVTEVRCPPAGFTTNYTNLDGSLADDHVRRVVDIVRQVSPDSHIYCRGLGPVNPLTGRLLLQVPTLEDRDGLWPPIRVTTMSAGYNNLVEYTAQDSTWDNLAYVFDILPFHLAGNNDAGVNIPTPGKGMNVVTVGNYDDATDTIAASSNFVDPPTRAQKPEISAPGQNIVAGGFAEAASGTSFSTPHAAGIMANYMSEYPWLTTNMALAKSFILGVSKKAIAGGQDAVGVGGVNFFSGVNQMRGDHEGFEGTFLQHDGADGRVDNTITRYIYLKEEYENVRIVLSWLNEAQWTFDNSRNAFPLGRDLDIWLYSPQGHFVTGSVSRFNPYEILDINPSVTGTFRLEIKQQSNRDTSSAFTAGLSVNYAELNPMCVDPDGDGWGWDGVGACRVEGGSGTDCEDTDGDGWGWDGVASCRVGIASSGLGGACVDTDGDGWGWDGVKSCIP